MIQFFVRNTKTGQEADLRQFNDLENKIDDFEFLSTDYMIEIPDCQKILRRAKSISELVNDLDFLEIRPQSRFLISPFIKQKKTLHDLSQTTYWQGNLSDLIDYPDSVIIDEYRQGTGLSYDEARQNWNDEATDTKTDIIKEVVDHQDNYYRTGDIIFQW